MENVNQLFEGQSNSVEDIERIFRVLRLELEFENLKPLIIPKINFSLSPLGKDEIRVGQSKLGGKPDLLTEREWPKTDEGESLSFIGQLNCEELSSYDETSLIPKKGLISFFHCSENSGYSLYDADKFKILYHEDLSNLKRIDYPNDLDQYVEYAPSQVFPANLLRFQSNLSLPSFNEEECIEDIIKYDDRDIYFKIADYGTKHQIFGYPADLLGFMKQDCELFTNGIDNREFYNYTPERQKEIEIASSDWVLLLQINSDPDVNMYWGDRGFLYFWIRRQDILQKIFDNTWFMIQGL